MLYSTLFLFIFFIASNADLIYLKYYKRGILPETFTKEVESTVNENYVHQPYNWQYLEEEAALYDKCGGNTIGVNRVEYYDKQYKNAYYYYLVHENTEYFCDLTQRLVLKTGAILEGCKAPETWYYKVPILDTEEDS